LVIKKEGLDPSDYAGIISCNSEHQIKDSEICPLTDLTDTTESVLSLANSLAYLITLDQLFDLLMFSP
jgi:hypothetical protein